MQNNSALDIIIYTKNNYYNYFQRLESILQEIRLLDSINN